MNKLIEQFTDTLVDSGLGHMLAIALSITLIMVAWGFQKFILKKFDLW